MKLAKGRWRALTKSTETIPTKFQVGVEVTFWMDDFAPWQGGKGIVREARKANYGTHGMDYKVEVTEAPPKNSAVKAGHQTWFEEGWLRLVERVLPAEEDVVNHPSHYTQYPVEVIELTRHMPFCDGNVVKYVARSPYKGNRLQDLKKARWYLDDAIAQEEQKLEEAK